ncbi:MAG: cyclophilin-like fold protein [Promethearchaeota archaeon]
MNSIIIESEDIGQVKAKLLIDKNPKTCQSLFDALPMDLNSKRWGDCLYSYTPLHLEAENTQIDVAIGDVGYWMDGHAFVIFFGPTPHSTDETPRAASAINIFGKIEGDPLIFKKFETLTFTVKKGN